MKIIFWMVRNIDVCNWTTLHIDNIRSQCYKNLSFWKDLNYFIALAPALQWTFKRLQNSHFKNNFKRFILVSFFPGFLQILLLSGFPVPVVRGCDFVSLVGRRSRSRWRRSSGTSFAGSESSEFESWNFGKEKRSENQHL